MEGDDTVEASGAAPEGGDGRPLPGVVIVFARGEAVCAALSLEDGGRALGRSELAALGLDDPRASRRHAHLAFEDGAWRILDLGSRNGTYVDGERVVQGCTTARPRVIRIGETLCVPMADVRPFGSSGVEIQGGLVMGPALRAAWARIARAAQVGDVLHLTGESGTGKELAARHFHVSRPRQGGELVAVNCAAVPSGIAERLFFGVRRGTYSGADADADGYLQAAQGGTLFLDEIGDLDASVQAKLLRAVETRLVTPLGASRPRAVSFGLCSATHEPLEELVSAGRFRADLYFRMGRPAVRLPPLRERPEEIAALIARTVAAEGRRAHASLVETALLRAWPGNVRELVTEIRQAAQAVEDGAAVSSRQLAEGAGSLKPTRERAPPETHAVPRPLPPATTAPGPREKGGRLAEPSPEAVRDALEAKRGNVTAAARALGLHRTQLRRILARSGERPDKVEDP